MHDAGAVALTTPPVTMHSAPDTAYDTTPVPDPPLLVNVTCVHATAERTAFDTTSEAWDAAVNVNTTGLLDTGPNTPDAAFDAVTEHVVGADTDTLTPDTTHPDPDTENDTTPVPDPPLLVNVTGVPATPDTTVFDTTRSA